MSKVQSMKRDANDANGEDDLLIDSCRDAKKTNNPNFIPVFPHDIFANHICSDAFDTPAQVNSSNFFFSIFFILAAAVFFLMLKKHQKKRH